MVQKIYFYSRFINPEIIYVSLGLWLIAAPYIFGYYNQEHQAEFVSGLVLLWTGMIPVLSYRRRAIWQKILQLVAGFMLFFAPLYVYGPETISVDVLTGSVIIFFTFVRLNRAFRKPMIQINV